MFCATIKIEMTTPSFNTPALNFSAAQAKDETFVGQVYTQAIFEMNIVHKYIALLTWPKSCLSSRANSSVLQ
jgi:hypothetical protein